MINMEKNKTMNNAKWLFIIALGIYVVSSTFSLLFYTDGTYTEEGRFLSSSMAILAQIITYAFPSLGITLMFSYKNDNKKILWTGKVSGFFIFVFGLALIGYSIIASSGFLWIEKENKNKTAYRNSESYKLAEKENKRSTNEYDKAVTKIEVNEKKLAKLEDSKIKSFNEINDKYENKDNFDISNNNDIKRLDNEIIRFKKLDQYKNGVNPCLAEKNNIIANIKANNLKLAENEKAEYNKSINALKIEIKQLKEIKDTEKIAIVNSSEELKSNINNKIVESSYDGYYKSLFSQNIAKQLSSKTLLVLSSILEISPTFLVFASVVLYGFEPIKWMANLYPVRAFNGIIRWIFNILTWIFELIGIKIARTVSNAKLKKTELGITAKDDTEMENRYNKAMEIYKLNLDNMKNEINKLKNDKNNSDKKTIIKKSANITNKNIDITAKKVYELMKEEYDKTGKVLSVKSLSDKLRLNSNKIQGARELLKENGLIESIPLKGRANKIIIK
jgi:hypothetical protein